MLRLDDVGYAYVKLQPIYVLTGIIHHKS